MSKYFREPGWETRVRSGIELDVKVRFSECDPYGHMNNTIPFIYFEDARIELLEATGFSLKDGFVVVADAQCDYVRQVMPRQLLKVYANVLTVGNTSCDIHYGAYDGDQLMFAGRTSLVHLSKAGRPAEWTPEYKNRLQNFCESAII
ncbi:acyl-CoA thioesterase [Exiguobacterium sp. SH5S4]|uniref:acyl-CoA thioesterase n=1 Tax=Exiguobacterium sp. SH5S4 TaxID=2510961 RepID=UPI001038D0FA|nr:thioesterase family protein [Exiguobacterium sp. SH5S4]TCI26402.1 acyl-CoA thioesterase [Exiguobacterium sp. SH5S4]